MRVFIFALFFDKRPPTSGGAEKTRTIDGRSRRFLPQIERKTSGFQQPACSRDPRRSALKILFTNGKAGQHRRKRVGPDVAGRMTQYCIKITQFYANAILIILI